MATKLISFTTFPVILLLFVSYALSQENKIIEIKCTDNCVCDYFCNLRRATCIDQKMLYVKDNIPRKTQILEFSYNHLSKIHTDEFHDNELDGLKVLNVSHNRISEIDIFAFEPLDELEILDMSHNALQYVLAEWFWEFTSLKELYLSNNNLGSFKNVALFESKTLQVLDLSHCEIPHIHDLTLSEMPALEVIDLSNNYLITMKTSIIENLQNLTEIRLQKNAISCDNLNEFVVYLREMSIEHKTDCQDDNNQPTDVENVSNNVKHDNEKKFDKIIDWTKHSDSNITFWKVEEVVKIEIQDKECPPEHKDFFESIIGRHVYISTAVCISFGFIVGMICGCLCRFCKYSNKQNARKRRNIKSMHRISRSYSFRGGAVQDRELLI